VDTGIGARSIAQVLEGHTGERHLIALQDYPDPDAIASAVAHRALSRQYGIEADIAYAGAISHHQNRALVVALQVDLRHVSQVVQPDRYDGVVLLDNQGTTNQYLVRLLRRAGVPIVLAVDHHVRQPGLEARNLIHQLSGATSTIYAGYLQHGVLEVALQSEQGRRLATALLFGILTDTGWLKHGDAADLQAGAFLMRWSDADLLRRIQEEPVPWATSEILRRALTTRQDYWGFTVAGVGYLRAEDRDAIPQAADFLLSVEGMTSSIVFGIVRDWRVREVLAGSLRTSDPQLAPDRFLKTAFGGDFLGRSFGGGRAFAGAFEIPIGMSSKTAQESYQIARWLYYEYLVNQQLLQAITATLRGRDPSRGLRASFGMSSRK